MDDLDISSLDDLDISSLDDDLDIPPPDYDLDTENFDLRGIVYGCDAGDSFGNLTNWNLDIVIPLSDAVDSNQEFDRYDETLNIPLEDRRNIVREILNYLAEQNTTYPFIVINFDVVYHQAHSQDGDLFCRGIRWNGRVDHHLLDRFANDENYYVIGTTCSGCGSC